MHINFLIIQENEAENVFMMLDALLLAWQINFHHHKYFHDLKFSLLKLHGELMNDKCAINLSFSVHDNIHDRLNDKLSQSDKLNDEYNSSFNLSLT